MGENALDIELYDYVGKNIWPQQWLEFLNDIDEMHPPKNKQKRNLMLSRIKRNVIYKPFVYIDNALMSNK